MGLNIRINGITSQNQFKLFYKTGSTAGNESVITTGYTQYTTGSDFSGGIYEKSTVRNYSSNPIIFTNASYNTQYWFKLYDTVTSGYTIENIYTNHQEYYDSCINCCYFSGGTAQYLVDCTFSGGTASYTLVTPTPTATPTPTSTPVDCTFSGGTASYTLETPTPTSTVTPTPTPTESITPTSSGNVNWYFSRGSGTSCTGSHFEIFKNGINVVLRDGGSDSGFISVVAGDVLVISVDTGNQSSPTGCSSAYVQYSGQQFDEDSPGGFTSAEITVTVSSGDIAYASTPGNFILICGTIGGGVCPV